MSRISGKTWAVAAIAAAIGFGSAVSYQTVASASTSQLALEPREHMKHALESLHNAKEELDRADHEYHGHRVKAIEATSAAIDHVEAALRD